MSAVVISVESVRADNAILLDYLNSTVAVEELVIGSTAPNIPRENNCMQDEPHFRTPGGSGD